jgi:uncharacterized membrane protein YuzA (DUF378 family)
MKLYTNCTHCSKEITFSCWEPDRVELSKAKGEEIELSCKSFLRTDSYHVNSINATESKLAQIVGLLIFLLGTPLIIYCLWDYMFRSSYIYAIAGLAGIITVPFMIYSVMEKEEREKVRNFNHFKINE